MTDTTAESVQNLLENEINDLVKSELSKEGLKKKVKKVAKEKRKVFLS